MIQIRKSDERGNYNYGWLNTFHTFSFSRYYDPNFMGFSDLLVINEDIIQPGEGFPKHWHNNMEIFTYILEGELEHRDSMGNGSVIKKGEIQFMSAGRNVTHSEYNPSKTNEVHLLQIWILPDTTNLEPSYSQKDFSQSNEKITLALSKNGENDSLKISQDVKVNLVRLGNGESAEYANINDRNFWLQVTKGSFTVNDSILNTGDGAAIWEDELLKIKGTDSENELILFDLK